MPHFSRDIGQRLRPTFKGDEDIVIKYIIAEKEREGQDIGPIEARRIALASYRSHGEIRSFAPQPSYTSSNNSPMHRSKHRSKGPKIKSGQ